MNRSIALCLLLTACDGGTHPEPETEPKPEPVRELNDIECLRADQLDALRRSAKTAENRSVAAQLVDASPRQVEEYGKTGKWPSQTQEEIDQDEKDAYGALMDVGSTLRSGLCMDWAISSCIAEGGKGLLCFNMATRACPGYEAKSHCDPSVGKNDGND